MEKKKFRFSQRTTTYHFGASFNKLPDLVDVGKTFFVTDENVFVAHAKKFKGLQVIVIKAGEEQKVQSTVDAIVEELIRRQADRKSIIIGVGGGVITDLAGYVASVYMRGVRFGFLPASILAMVDASIGGKNGIDVGVYKNLVGTINQPEFLLYDTSLLKSLPDAEWVNGFAEIIKHGCIKDAKLISELESTTIRTYKKDQQLLLALIKRNAVIKSKVVTKDEFEQGERKLLNFGHTWGHAIETKHKLPHGHAVAIGMVMACRLSEKLTGFKDTARVIKLLERYGLPVSLSVNKTEVFEVLKMDKKKDRASMNYVLLNKIGNAMVKNIPIDQLEALIKEIP